MGILSELTQYGGTWEVVNTRAIDPKKENFKKADVVENEVTMPDGTSFTAVSICFHMNSGCKTYIRLSSKSDLEVGDPVDINSIEQIELEKEGSSIFRADGKKSKRATK